MISRSSKRRMLITGGQSCCMICLQAKSIQNSNSALDQHPEQSPNSALKTSNVQLQPLQLLRLAHDSLLLE
jgi:hypothetical protein